MSSRYPKTLSQQFSALKSSLAPAATVPFTVAPTGFTDDVSGLWKQARMLTGILPRRERRHPAIAATMRRLAVAVVAARAARLVHADATGFSLLAHDAYADILCMVENAVDESSEAKLTPEMCTA